MKQILILQPVAALALFTLLVLLLMPYQRVKAFRAKQVTEDDFKFGESARVPTVVSIPNRNYMNLLELPILFYAANIILFITGKADTIFLYMAWTYVGLRICHSAVHLTYNRVLHRMFIFGMSNGVLAVMWLRIVPLLV
ncbi:MAG: MAPEG family protein [Gammaproteobacteria bacterium]|nr:MAPEG family protein [Gammaproteobacteria bacterium]